ncbi:MAG: AsnC family transcriptional regulator [Candidatus Thorarchaeota archaeon]
MDNIDKLLISILREDGRASLSEIGKKLGERPEVGGKPMSHVAVSKRLNRLKKDGILKVTAGVNAEKLGAKVIFLGLETENMDVAEKIIQKYKHCPRLITLAQVTGRYNLFAVMVAEDTISLESILGTCSMRVEEGVRRSETWFGNAPSIPQFIPMDLAPNTTDGKVSGCGCKCLSCRRFELDKCVGCPETAVYKGKLWATKKHR